MDIDKDTRGKQYRSLREIERLSTIQLKYMRKCKCSHSILFTGRKDRLLCSHCGHYVYKDKQTELRYKLKEIL